jgi:hypothetical protein
MPRFHLTVAALAAGLVLLLAAPARASCAAPLSVRKAIKQAPSVFVATVVDVTNGKRWATVDVEEVWKGPELASEVDIRAGPKDPPGPVSAASSVDRTFDRGARYLFIPYKGYGSVFYDNACTRTARFGPAHGQVKVPTGGQSKVPARPS